MVKKKEKRRNRKLEEEMPEDMRGLLETMRKLEIHFAMFKKLPHKFPPDQAKYVFERMASFGQRINVDAKEVIKKHGALWEEL